MASTGQSSYYSPQQQFSYNATPYGGAAAKNNIYGTSLPQINMPQPASDLGAQLPGLPQANNQLSSVINSELSGQISPDTMNLLKNASASAGVAGGVPGSQFQQNNELANLGLTSQQQQQTGVANYNSTIPTVSSTQTTNPALQYEVNLQNATNAAAPSPAAAANEEQDLLQQYMNELTPGQPIPQKDGAYESFVGSNYKFQTPTL